VLALWLSDQVLSKISDHVAKRVTDVCMLPWGDEAYANAWPAAQNAPNLVTGQDQAPATTCCIRS
jgi:hypothetical protein